MANLAAFLTSETISTVSTMQGAVDAGMKICAHPALKEELVIKWPLAKFEFSSGRNFNGSKTTLLPSLFHCMLSSHYKEYQFSMTMKLRRVK